MNNTPQATTAPPLHLSCSLPACAHTLTTLLTHQGIALAPTAEEATWLLTISPETCSLTTPHTTLFQLAPPLRLGALAQALLHAQHSWFSRPVPLGAGWVCAPLHKAFQHEGGTSIELTDKEYALFTALLQASAPLSREVLTQRIWGHSDAIDSHTLDTHLYRLRGKCDQLTGLTLEIRAEAQGFVLSGLA